MVVSFKRYRIAGAVLLTLALMLLSACGDGGILPSAGATTPPPAPPSATLQPAPESPQFPQIDSSTARKPITAAIYDLFTNTYGYAGPEPLASKTHEAWLNLADGKADIVFLVAPTEDEMAYFAEKGVDIEMKVYGYDGLVFMGNESNPVENLTSDQIRSIYSGNIKNWIELGGENADILVYIRNPESGSQRLFESLVWEGYDMPDFSAMNFAEGEIDPTVTQREVIVEEDMGDITYSVLLNQYSIGFNIMSYIDSEFADSTLKLFSVDGYAPTTENFASGGYPFLTTSYVAIRADAPEGSPARMLYDWVGSEESYALFSENSTLAVAFTESVVIQAGAGDPVENAELADMILKLDQQVIERRDLFRFTLEEIGYLRNGVYALSGKLFKTEKYARYFSVQSWYEGTDASDTVVSNRFNDFQKENLKIILAYEKELNLALANR